MKLFKTLLVLVIFVSQMSASLTSQTKPTYAIAYSSDNNIHLSDTDGKAKIKITDYDGGNGYSAWSPDGNRIAFYSKYDDRKTWSIHTMNAEGSNRKRLTDLQFAWDNSPTWSPDGSKIAFARAYKDAEEVRQYEIWIMNADGTDKRQIKGLKGGGPYFTSDGRILFHSQPGPSDIFIANADGSNLVQLTHNDAEDWHPEISADGRQIAFMSDRGGNHEIYVMNADGSNQKGLTNMGEDSWYPSWSPDGSQLIFSSSKNEERQLYKMNADGSSIVPIIENASQAVWLKTGQKRSEGSFNFQGLEGPYLGQKPPGLTSEVFAPGIVTTEDWGDAGSFSPDMNEFHVGRWRVLNEKVERKYVVFKKVDSQWEEIEMPESTRKPSFSPDGKTLYFGSKYKEFTQTGWSELKSLGPSFDEIRIMSLMASSKGTLVFDEVGTNGNGQLRYSRFIDGQYEEPVPFSKEINTGTWNAHPFIAPDESYMMWDGEREDGYGSSDLYISFRQDDGSWGAAINLGDKINTAAEEGGPQITPDGKYLFFNRMVTPASGNAEPQSDLFWVDAKIIEDLRIEN